MLLLLQPPPQRKSQQGKPKGGKPPLIHVTLSLREDVKLHETENAWKPGVLVSGGKESDEEEAKTQVCCFLIHYFVYLTRMMQQ